MVITNLFAPGEMTNVNSKKVESVEPSKLSMMPPGLLNTLSDDDILDLERRLELRQGNDIFFAGVGLEGTATRANVAIGD